MAVGQVAFHNDRKVKRDNAIVNRLNKTKVEREVDHEAERQERQRAEGRKKKNEAMERKRLEDEQKQKWAEEKKMRTYEGMFTDEAIEAYHAELSDDDFM